MPLAFKKLNPLKQTGKRFWMHWLFFYPYFATCELFHIGHYHTHCFFRFATRFFSTLDPFFLNPWPATRVLFNLLVCGCLNSLTVPNSNLLSPFLLPYMIMDLPIFAWILSENFLWHFLCQCEGFLRKIFETIDNFPKIFGKK